LGSSAPFLTGWVRAELAADRQGLETTDPLLTDPLQGSVPAGSTAAPAAAPAAPPAAPAAPPAAPAAPRSASSVSVCGGTRASRASRPLAVRPAYYHGAHVRGEGGGAPP
jgi:hypothetical protein